MAGSGKTLGSGALKKAQSRRNKAGLQFPVGRIARFLKASKYADCVGVGAPVYLPAVLEYLAIEVQMAIKNAGELSKLLRDVTIANGGVMSNIHNLLLPKKVGGSSKPSAYED